MSKALSSEIWDIAAEVSWLIIKILFPSELNLIPDGLCAPLIVSGSSIPAVDTIDNVDTS